MAQAFEIHEGDVKIRRLPLWIDAARRRPLSFISHAHADHVGRHRRVICTQATRELLRARNCVGDVAALDFGESMELAGASLTLFPAGHVLGSAQILVETDGLKIGYTGDFKLGGGLTTEPAAPLQCDVLLMECTYGHPRYVFPDISELLRRLREFVERSFDCSSVPVLLAYSLGKAQEAIKALEALGYGALALPQVMRICRVYTRFGVAFPNLEPMRASAAIGRRVVVAPPFTKALEQLLRGTPARTAALTGWAIEGRQGGFFGVDEAIPFSDHCDFASLIRAARQSNAAKIYTLHGDAERFADYLRGEGLDAEPLFESAQGRLF